jgi:hypothetical protein
MCPPGPPYGWCLVVEVLEAHAGVPFFDVHSECAAPGVFVVLRELDGPDGPVDPGSAQGSYL